MEVLLRTPLTRQDWLGRSDRSKSNPGTACGLCQRIQQHARRRQLQLPAHRIEKCREIRSRKSFMEAKSSLFSLRTQNSKQPDAATFVTAALTWSDSQQAACLVIIDNGQLRRRCWPEMMMHWWQPHEQLLTSPPRISSLCTCTLLLPSRTTLHVLSASLETCLLHSVRAAVPLL